MNTNLLKIELKIVSYLQRMVELNKKNWDNTNDVNNQIKRIEYHLFEIELLITGLEKDII